MGHGHFTPGGTVVPGNPDLIDRGDAPGSGPSAAYIVNEHGNTPPQSHPPDAGSTAQRRSSWVVPDWLDAIAEFVGLLETSSMRARPGVDYPGRVDLPQRLVSEEPEGPVLAVARGSDATVPRGFREFWGVASGVVERGLADFPGCFLGGIGRWFALTILWTRVLGDRRSILILRRCWS